MAFLKIPNVAIRGISACVPPKVEENRDLAFYTAEEAEKVIATTGVERKHIVRDDGITSSDLCLKACEKLLDDLGWERHSIDLICNVTQTSDYTNHPNAFVLHEKLGLCNDCMALDLYHGCPGWVVGLSSAAALMSPGSIKRVLLLDGDIISKIQYGLDRESRPLFGDAGTATALEFDENAAPLLFHTGTNSVEGRNLIRKRGGWRNPFTAETFQKEQDLISGKLPTDIVDDTMDGMNVFSFGITIPPKSMKALCKHYGINLDNVDKLVVHQANLFLVNKIAKKMKFDSARVPIGLRDYGNTTSASIPLTIVTECADDYRSGKQRTLACSFGTGLAWASVYFETEGIACPEVVVY